MPPVQLTQINAEMEGHEEMRISIQTRMIPCCKTSRNQPIQYLFFKEPGFAGWDRLTCKKDGRCWIFSQKLEQKRTVPKKPGGFAGGLSWGRNCLLQSLLFRWAVEEGGEQWNKSCVQGLRSLWVSTDRTPKMFSLGIETEESVENFLRTADIFPTLTPGLMFYGRQI